MDKDWETRLANESNWYTFFFKLEEKVHLESYKDSRNEPAGLCRLQNKLQKQKKGPWSLEKGKAKLMCLGVKKKRCGCAP